MSPLGWNMQDAGFMKLPGSSGCTASMSSACVL